MKEKLVYIEWIDSCATVPTWMSKEDALEWGKESESYKIVQVGFILKKTKKVLLLVSRISPDQVGGVFRIPMQCITKITSLKP